MNRSNPNKYSDSGLRTFGIREPDCKLDARILVVRLMSDVLGFVIHAIGIPVYRILLARSSEHSDILSNELFRIRLKAK